MSMNNTKQKLAIAAAELLDEGGQEAVTLRAVAERVGVSHNAPYRHFKDRSVLLAGVAEIDFNSLLQAFELALAEETSGHSALRRAIDAFVGYAIRHPARYRLLFSDPMLQATDDLRKAAFAPFESFAAIVGRCQDDGSLPPADTVQLTGMIYATLHGAIDLEIGGRSGEAKGLKSISATVELLFRLIGPSG